ncbi:phosphomannomutase/phosphoglucomutase [Streptococcus ruminantium]|uniref:Phosphomannomutase/phosphoglucomutase n=1 Tax=Streptococcus ruminantium TaxID=1917441 RepID=A0ABU1B0R6_9STRE|nr:phosphomannomutase/phosphoglucomutase [Streptococcus ruminantium]MDQ8758410.1 phosphomannomutase/phosphoglucomutase [Streptococcus ruminantium]MDQ8764662.1 phosphomannomutase/phosphoglucomutase [Streptococcus ruminantium]MDQ8768910.1 phosphomannomutase/phosphoglucomutase [Streptococcus ruminantium]MDQ8773873.1 phosphomannomutase/phosphoglucomutase [Streptococcus ruminantium]MDQ8794348.1 phosphomannomutase/phosphoglucomutase [Streptococcus ruminantium]
MSHHVLQNGSDIRGIAIATDEYAVNLTTQATQNIVRGLIHWLIQDPELAQIYQQGQLTIGIGRDSRLSGPDLVSAFTEEAVRLGVQMIDFGIATTPALFMSTQYPQFKCHAGVMITASHLPYYFNGIKIFSANGGAEHDDIDFILSHYEDLPSSRLGSVTQADLMTPYAQDLVTKIRQACKGQEKPLSGLKIIVDAGNGAGGFFAGKVLAELGADTTGSQFLDPDGTFPNHIPNPDNKEAMESIRQAVLKQGADLGIIFDTDVDRAALVTKSGSILNRNNLIAVLSQIILAEHPGTSIVTNSPTTEHLKVFIEGLGGKQIRYISGYRNVINKALETNKAGIDCQLAIETSGHAAFKENYFLDDGTYVAAKILMLLPKLQAQGQSLDDLIAQLKQPVETQEVRFKLESPDYRKLGEQVIAALRQTQFEGFTFNPENEEGVRFDLTAPYGEGWLLLRMSLHEPLLVLQVENDQAGHIPAVLQTISTFLDKYPTVNQEKLKELM